MSDFLIADPHFWHTNIIKYENRPFADVAEMNGVISENWKNIVSKKDKIFILGDFGFAAFWATVAMIANLPGHKLLIMGNHDRDHSAAWWLRAGMNEVSRYPIIYKKFYILSHEPLYINEHMPYINIHGHIHSKKMEGSQYRNVSVEHTRYSPVPMEEILKEKA